MNLSLNLVVSIYFNTFVSMASIYLHIPFCRQMCGYCDFFKTARVDKIDQAVSAMMDELAREREFMTTQSLSTIYFGGGTPSLLTPQQVGQLLERINNRYDTTHVTEVTLEANPDDLTVEYLEGLRDVGINRLSIGVQSFDDETLRFMNRRHNATQACRAIESARQIGFDNIAIDLIFGVDGFGGDRLIRSIEQAVGLDVEHIAAYHLTIESGTPFARRVAKGEFSVVAESVSEEEFEIVRRGLIGAGYDHYEISNYAKRGYESRHNSAYWCGEEYLGIGAGAHSFSRRGEWGIRRWSEGGLDQYLKGHDSGRYQTEMLTGVERRNEIIMTSLRRAVGLDLERFKELFGDAQLDRLLVDAAKAISRGDLLMDKTKRWMKIPTDRFLRSDMIIEELFLL